ncbi:DUF6807 domain-containing protein [Streptomyces sp. NPDC002851]
MNSTLLLRCSGRTVGLYSYRPDVAPTLSPRPYLHPVRTLGGTTVTEERPADHPHHLGVGVAVADVRGHNFWGGNTFVRGTGPVALDNHGIQHHQGFKLRDPDGFVADLSWTAGTAGAHGGSCGPELLRERRTVAVTELTDTAWALDFTFSLTNPTREPLTLGSPATNGRPGAAYGGFFWRAPKEARAPQVFTADTDGEESAHESRADWLALSGTSPAWQPWTLVFAGATEETRRDPWFVRAAEYPGVGSSLAHAERLAVPPGGTVVRRIVTVVADGHLDRDTAAALVRKAVTA